MRGALLMIVAACSACAGAGRTRVVTAYAARSPLARVAVEVVNLTGRELPLPPPGLIEQAVRVVTRQPEAEGTIPDALARAAGERLAGMGVSAAPSGEAGAPRLRISLSGWDLRDGEASGGVLFVSAGYQLLDEEGQVLWEVRQERQPVRLSGPNLGRYDALRAARSCTDIALSSLAAAGRDKPRRSP